MYVYVYVYVYVIDQVKTNRRYELVLAHETQIWIKIVLYHLIPSLLFRGECRGRFPDSIGDQLEADC